MHAAGGKCSAVEAFKPRRPGGFTLVELLVVVGIIGILFVMLIPATRSAGGAARRSQCTNNLKQIGIALQNYEEVYGALPPAYTVDAQGRPLHSWRTLILPFVEQKPLYDTIDLSKPWNDPANAEVFKASIPAYLCPAAGCPMNHTTYLAILSPDSCIQSLEPRALSDITDDPAQTLLVIEVDREHSVPWMAPVDADETLLQSWGAKSTLAHSGGVNAVFVDGHVTFLKTDLSEAQWRKLVSIAGDRP